MTVQEDVLAHSNLESRIQSLVELAREMEIDRSLLDDKQNAFLHQLKQTNLQL